MLGFKSVGAVQETVQPAFDAVGSAVSSVANSDVLSGMPAFDPYGLLFPEGGSWLGSDAGEESESPDFDVVGPRKGGTVPVAGGEGSLHATREDDANGSRRGLEAGGERTTKVGGQEVGGSANASVDAGWTATQRTNRDGTITIEGSADLKPAVGLKGIAGPAEAAIGLGATAEARATVKVTPEQYQQALAAAHGDPKAARGLLVAQGVHLDPATLQEGESWGRTFGVSMNTKVALGIGASAEGQASRDVDVRRTKEGFEIDLSQSRGGTVGGSVDGEAAAVSAEVSKTRGRERMSGVHLELPDTATPEQIRGIAEAGSPQHAATLALLAGGTVTPTHSSTDSHGQEQRVGTSVGSYGHTSEGNRTSVFDGNTETESGEHDAEHAFGVGDHTFLADEVSSNTTCEADVGGEWSCDIEREHTRTGFGWDGLETAGKDVFGVLASAVTREDTQTDAHRLHQDQMDALIASAQDPDAFDRAFVDPSVRTYAKSAALRERLAALQNVPAELKYQAVSRILADHTAAGGSQADLQRAAAAAGAKRWEWPDTIPEGRERFTELEASVADLEHGADPTALGTDLDRLFMELQRADGFTIPQARADMLERVDELRARAHAARLARTTDPDARAELLTDRQFQKGWTDLAVVRALKADEQLQLEQMTGDHWGELEAWRFYDRLSLARAEVQPIAGADVLAATLPDVQAIEDAQRREYNRLSTGLADRLLHNQAPK